MNLTTEKIDMPEAINFILGQFDMEGWLGRILTPWLEWVWRKRP